MYIKLEKFKIVFLRIYQMIIWIREFGYFLRINLFLGSYAILRH